MGNWVSKLGKWVPAKEYSVDPGAERGKEVYQGPDRDSVEHLKSKGVDHLGMDYRRYSDTIRAARELGFKSVDEYLHTMFEFDREKAEAKAAEMADTEVDHRQEVKRSKQTVQPSGGDDTSGQGKHRKGGFGEPDGISGADLGKRV